MGTSAMEICFLPVPISSSMWVISSPGGRRPVLQAQVARVGSSSHSASMVSKASGGTRNPYGPA